MNKLRQSLRRKKPSYVPEASRPHQWQADEEAVRKGRCSFPVRVSSHPFPSWAAPAPFHNPIEALAVPPTLVGGLWGVGSPFICLAATGLW